MVLHYHSVSNNSREPLERMFPGESISTESVNEMFASNFSIFFIAVVRVMCSGIDQFTVIKCPEISLSFGTLCNIHFLFLQQTIWAQIVFLTTHIVDFIQR